MNKSLHFKNAALLAAFALNLSLVFGALARQTAAQTAPAAVSNNPNAIELSVTMQAVERKTNKTIADLTANDLRLFENGKEQRITRVETDTRPLSIAVVARVGVPPITDFALGGFNGDVGGRMMLAAFMPLVAHALQQHLQPDEEVAVFVGDASGRQVRGLSGSNKALIDDFNTARTLINSKLEGFNPGGGPAILLPLENNPFVTIENAVRGFNDSKVRNRRQVLLMLNVAGDIADTTEQQRQRQYENLLAEEIVVPTIGVVMGTFPALSFLTTRNYYNTLPRETGGEVFSFFFKDFRQFNRRRKKQCRVVVEPPTDFNCEILDFGSPEFAKLIEERGFPAFLDRMRTRYRIAYNSTDKTDKPREIRLELRGKKRAELHYQRRVIAPAQ